MSDSVPERILSVVVPMYNEEGTLAEVLGKILVQKMVGEVVLVDDGSSDRTAQIARQWENDDERVRFIQHHVNQGKGAALRTGFLQAKMPYVIVQDADLEYNPEEFY